MPYVGRDLQRGNYLKLDDLESQFNGSKTTFNLESGGSAFYPGSAYSILVSLGGIVQEPESAYTINQNTITFAAAPVATTVDTADVIAAIINPLQKFVSQYRLFYIFYVS